MGYRGKVVERQQARRLRRAGLPLDEIAAQVGVSKSSVSLWVRDVELDVPVIRSARVAAGTRMRCSGASRGRSSGSWKRVGPGSGGCRSGSSCSRGSRCTPGKERNEMARSASPTATRA